MESIYVQYLQKQKAYARVWGYLFIWHSINAGRLPRAVADALSGLFWFSIPEHPNSQL